MSTIRDLIKGALDSIGVLAEGETPNADQEEAARLKLNRMLGSWSIDGLLVKTVAREEFTLVAATASRTLGASGNFNTTQPVKILAATIENQATADYIETPVEILTPEQWAAIENKTVTADVPAKIFMDGAYPLNVVYFWPIPSAANKLVLYSEKPLSAYASVSTDFSMPEGYEEAVIMHLGRRLANDYGKVLAQDYITLSDELLGNVKRKNLKPQLMECDPALLERRSYDIYKGP